MIVNEFIPKPYKQLLERGAAAYSAPSNIALVKYWGKKAHQIPANPSISFTLDNSFIFILIVLRKTIVHRRWTLIMFPSFPCISNRHDFGGTLKDGKLYFTSSRKPMNIIKP